MHKVGENRKILGVLGGLGPLSSAYFYELVTGHTKAVKDQDHIDIILSSRATTPDRTAFILGKSDEDPVPFMVEDARLLEQYGADAIVIPCNTAHYFIDEVRRSVSVPVPSIITETVSHIARNGHKKVAILATEGTVFSGSYQAELERFGLEWAVPDESGQKIITDIIYGDVKSGVIPPPEKLFSVADVLFDDGCTCAILGCTELSLLKRRFPEDTRFVDSLEVLASCAIKLFDHETVGFTEDFYTEEVTFTET
ncbi:MAG: amino acid racemase [Clostridia bacterium]|nr:amino acid racemase [Clostridia bacterium]